MKMFNSLWSSSDFDSENLTRFAQPVMRREAVQGIFTLGMLTMVLMSGLAVLYYALSRSSEYFYTFAVLAALSLHIALSAKAVSDIRVLYLLGMVLLALCGLAFVLLAHRYGVFTATLLSTVALLFMVVPLVPWGLREAMAAIGVVYAIFTASTLSVAGRFTHETLWTLQFLMLSAAVISLALVARAIAVRKGHIEARFNLSESNELLQRLSHRDPLTDARNRRFLEEQYPDIVARYGASGRGFCLGVVDIDDFKRLNDTCGHACGDRVLQRLVRVFLAALGQNEYVVRMGGDEFVLLLEGDEVQPRLARALAEFGAPEAGAADATPMPGVSIGIARVPAGMSAPLEALYALGDKALYAAKAAGRSSLVTLDYGRQQSA